MTRECPACKQEIAEGQPAHKLLAYDVEPEWFDRHRFWVCAVTAPILKQMTEDFDKRVNPMDWIGPMEKQK